MEAQAKSPIENSEIKFAIHTGIPRQDYVIARLNKAEMTKLRKWLDSKVFIEVATSQHGQVYLFNRTKIERAR